MRTLPIILLLLSWQFSNAQPFIKTQICYNIHYGVAFDVAPDGRFFVTEKGYGGDSTPSRIKLYDASGNFLSVFYDLSDSVLAGGEAGLLGITLDPNFTSNHYVYVFYTYGVADSISITDERILIQRFTDVNNLGTQPVIIFNYPADSIANQNYSPIFHVGGNIHFRPSDSTHIYVTIGDMFTGYTDDTPARLDNPLGKILRIGKYPHQFPPSDNPFYDDGNPYTGNCDWIWSYGHRNAFDFCFGPNDSLYSTENGTNTRDEVNLITRGGFYGWPFCEGSLDGDTLSLPCHEPNALNPIAEFAFPLPALTGIIFYTDTAFSAQRNHLITGDFNHADLSEIFLANGPAYNTADSVKFWIDESNITGISDLKQAADGCIYVLEIGDSIFGGIYKVCPDPNTVEESPVESTVLVMPNPFTEFSTIQYSLQQNQQVTIELFDISGRLIATLLDETQTSGLHDVEVDAQKYTLSPGVYTCILRGEHLNSAVKLVVQ